MTWRIVKASALCLPVWLALAAPALAAPPLQDDARLTLPGVNLASGSFGSPGNRREFDYTYPKKADIDYYTDKGFKSFRLSFLAKRLLSKDDSGQLVPTDDMNILAELIDYAAAKGATVILDMHDYGLTMSEKLIGRDPGSTEEFAAQWRAIAGEVARKPNVVFGLMNEPNRQTAAEWLEGANAAVAALRQAGAKQLVLVPGSYWDSAFTWTSTDNAEVMTGVRDPEKNFAFEVHQYLDSDNSGGHAEAVPGAGSTRLVDFTEWARKQGVRAFLGEFGWAANAPAQKEGHDLLCYMSRNQDVWQGWAYWAGGPWWGDYMYSIQPADGVDRPQMSVLAPFLNRDGAEC
jgi:endoglucanase